MFVDDSAAEDSSPAKAKKPKRAKGDKPPPKLTKLDAKTAAYNKSIMDAKKEASLGFAIMCLCPGPATRLRQPAMLTKVFNPRDAPIDEVKSFIAGCEGTTGYVDRANWDFALTLLVDRESIGNLEEIGNWTIGSPMVDIVWTITDAGGKVWTATLGNGNHRFEAVKELLKEEFAKLVALDMCLKDIISRREQPLAKDHAYELKAKRDVRDVWDVIEKKSTFAVHIYDRSEHSISF